MRDIPSVEACKLYEWVFIVNQDSRVYGFRNYRSTMDNLLIFKTDIIFNIVFAFISVLFIAEVYVLVNNEPRPVKEAGMFEDIIDFDTTSSEI
jgi:hypothetical protein